MATRTSTLPILTTVFLASTALTAQTAPHTIVLHCPNLFDSAAGKLVGQSTVVVEGERIKEVVSGFQSRPGANTIELAGGTCLPGLIDAHVHITHEFTPNQFTERFTLNPQDLAIRSTVFAKRTLLAGFTSIRNMGDDHYDSVALRNGINKGWVPGPRIFTAGEAIGTTGGHADDTDGLRLDLQGDPGPAQSIINGPEDAYKAIRQHYKEGVDVIKIMTSGGVLDLSGSADNPQMTQEEINAIVAAAHDYGFTVAVHAHGAEAIRRSVIGGVDSIEHGTFMDDRDMQLMKEHGTWYVPTIYTGQYVTERAKEPGVYAPQVAAKALQVGPQIMKTLSAAYKAGVKIAYGTDEGVYPHGQNWRDFPAMVQAGIPASYALQTATVNAAQLLKHDKDLGSITVGKYADIVAVPGNPLEDINVMSRVNFVMKGGTVYKQDGKELVFESQQK
jgi:imidazolonepropionase-like amidohydrolase